MTELVMRNYWWPEVIRDVGKYVNECDLCQRMKNHIEVPMGKLMVNKVPEKSWIYLTVNFFTKLPLVAGKDTVLVVYNMLSKIAYFVVTVEETSVKGLA